MRDWQRYLCLLVLGPVFWGQGKYVRKVTPQLPEPEGPREGVTGKGPILRLLIAGDSAAAGVGVNSQEHALCGQLVQQLSQRFTVKWQLTALTGLDSPGLESMLKTMCPQPIDVVVLSIGVNDVTNLMSPDAWIHWQTRLAQGILSRHSPKLLIHSAVPPMHGFTALPQPLRWFMGNWAKEMNQRLEQSLQGEARKLFNWPIHSAVSDGLASDGFHPGPIGYAAWATGLSEMIAEVNFEPFGGRKLDPNRMNLCC